MHNRESVREGMFAKNDGGENVCENVRQKTFARERSRGNVRERTFAKGDGGENVRERTFAKGDEGENACEGMFARGRPSGPPKFFDRRAARGRVRSLHNVNTEYTCMDNTQNGRDNLQGGGWRWTGN